MASQRTRRARRKGKQRGGRYEKTRRNHELYPPGPSQCRPRVGEDRPPFGCLPGSELKKVHEAVMGGAGHQGGNRKNKDLLRMRNEIASRLNVSPEEEATFIDSLPISSAEKVRLKKEYLRPKQPETWKDDPDMWLDSNNIRDVMTQYEEDRDDFEFLGPFPIDFAAPDPYKDGDNKDKCLIGEMCSLDIPGLRERGKTKVGIIYNLDPHYKSGSHWVANYIDLNKNHCYYFDSYGMEAPAQIQKFMQWLTLQEPKMKLAYNARRFQFKGSECGMYSMYFIIRMLMGEQFRPFCRRAPRDGAMLTLRGWLFSK